VKKPFLVKVLLVTSLLGTVATALWAQELGSQAPWFKSDRITSSRPLADVANVLQARYELPIAYEDPIWEWDGDAEHRDVGADSGRAGLMAWIPVLREFRLPAELTEGRPLALNVDLLKRVVAEYNRQNPTTRFRVVESKFGFHFVPETSHNTRGQVGPAVSALDTVIAVPEENRTAIAHFEAICDAVSHALGYPIEASAVGMSEDWYAELFDAPGGTLTWGAKQMTAREALADLLDHSATSFSWRLFCVPTKDSYISTARCVMNLRPIQIVVQSPPGTNPVVRLRYDRRKRQSPSNRQ
jgi:hypothetical protein